MSWSLLPARSEFAAHARTWDQLNHRLFGDHPLLAASFVEPLVQHFAGDGDVLAVHSPAGEPESMLLLRPGRFRWSSFVPSQTQIAPVLLKDVGELASLTRALPPTVVALDLLCQDPLCSRLAEAMPSAVHERFVAATTLNIGLSTDFDAYWSQRSSKLRQNLRRALRSIEGAGGECSLHYFAGEDDLGRALERYADIESRGWKSGHGTAIDLRSAQGRFYADMLARRARHGGAEIVELHVSGKVAASQILLLGGGMMITLKTTHDESLAEHSPGNVLDYLLLQREFASKRVQTIEYYTNASAELLRWGTAQREISHHRWYRRPWLRRLVGLWRGQGGPSAAQPGLAEAQEEAR